MSYEKNGCDNDSSSPGTTAETSAVTVLDRYAAADLLRPILAECGLRGCAELTAQLRLVEASEREAVG